MKYTNKIEKYLNEGKKAATAYNQMNKAVTTAIYGIKNMRKLIDDAPYNPKFGAISANLYKFEIDLEKKLRTFIPQIRVIANSKMLESVNEKMDKEQFHDYMQYVLKTQFKTPEEKKMKKSIIKKLNIANKKKGLRLFKEISGVQLAKKVVKNQQYEKGMDLFTAQYIVQTYDAYKKHPTLRKKIEKLSIAKAVKLANLVMRGS
jgi:hypothetical protein